MSPRLIIVAFAVLCAIHLHASAQGFQSVQAGLQPYYTRLTVIDTEVQTLEKTRMGLDVQEEDRLTAEEKIQKLQSEKVQLETYIQHALKFPKPPLVTY